MALKDTWVNKKNDEDFVMAEDINQIAQSVIDIEDELCKRFKWKGDYVENANYSIGDAVFYNGSSYICITAINEGETFPPSNEEYWELLASKGADGIGLPAATTEDSGKIIEVDENGAYVLKDLANSSVKTYIDDYINSALGGDY